MPRPMTPPRKVRHPHRRWAVAALAATALAISSAAALGAAGDPDPGFDGDGRAVLPFNAIPSDVLVQRDGKLVVPDADSSLVLRLNPDGSPDRGFGGDGAVAADFGPGLAIGAAALQPDGKIVVAGYAVKGDIAVARFNENGTLDGTFGPGGADGDGKRLYTNLAPRSVAGLLVQGDGKIVIAGDAIGGLAVSRVDSKGEPDGTTFDLADFPDAEETPLAAALAPDGAILVAGYTTKNDDEQFAVARFSADGKLDKSLASTGMLAFGTSADDSAAAVLVQPDGKIVLGGDSGGSEPSMVVARREHDGSPDTAFGQGGTAAPDFVGADAFGGLALQRDGKLLLAGTTVPEYLYAAARLDAGGQLDPSFGTGGRTTIRFEERTRATAAGLQGDGGLRDRRGDRRRGRRLPHGGPGAPARRPAAGERRPRWPPAGERSPLRRPPGHDRRHRGPRHAARDAARRRDRRPRRQRPHRGGRRQRHRLRRSGQRPDRRRPRQGRPRGRPGP